MKKIFKINNLVLIFMILFITIISISMNLETKVKGAITDSNPIVVWSNQYGSSSDDRFDASCLTSDNGTVSAGYTGGNSTNGINIGLDDGWIFKVDSIGNEIFSNQFGTTSYDYFTSIIETSDGGYIAAGRTYGSLPGYSNLGNYDGLIVRVDSNGNEIWSKQYGTTQYDQFYSIQKDSSTGYILVGYTRGTLPGSTRVGTDSDGWLLKIDEDGNEVWSKQYGTVAGDLLTSVQVANDGYVSAGYTSNSVASGRGNDAWILKVDNDGNEIFSKEFGSTAYDYIWSLIKTTDNAFVAVGDTYGSLASSTNLGGLDGWMLKIDSAGNELWAKQFGSSADDRLWSVIEDNDTYTAVGNTDGTVTNGAALGGTDGWFLQVSSMGEELRSSQYGTASNDYFRTVSLASNRSYVPSGYTNGTVTNGSNLGGIDGWIIKLQTTFNLSFNLNGGLGTVPATQALVKGGLASPVTAPTKDNYTFTGWNTSQDGNGLSWDFSSTLMSDADTILYAQWEIKSFNLSFDLNGGSGTIPAPQTLVIGGLASPVTAPTKDNYTFTGWNTKQDGSGTTWDFSSTTMSNTNITLYAQWEEKLLLTIPKNRDANSTLPRTGDPRGLFGFSILVIGLSGMLVALKRKKST